MPFSLLIKLCGKIVLLPVYHTVSDLKLPHAINLFNYRNKKQFERDLEFLQKHFSPITLFDLLSHVKGTKILPQKSFLVTFDDGYHELYKVVAPILNKRSITAVFFLNTAFIDNKDMSFRNKASILIDRLHEKVYPSELSELCSLLNINTGNVAEIEKAIHAINYQNRNILDEIAKIIHIDFQEYLKINNPYLSSHEIKELISNGFTIGSHSIDHPLFYNISLHEQLNQSISSLDSINECFNISYRVFAFPFTDKGVSDEFFIKTHHNGQIDVSFGTSNISKGYCINNLQRQPIERDSFTAEEIYKSLIRKHVASKVLKTIKVLLH